MAHFDGLVFLCFFGMNVGSGLGGFDGYFLCLSGGVVDYGLGYCMLWINALFRVF
jgi:hypothetical protein